MDVLSMSGDFTCDCDVENFACEHDSVGQNELDVLRRSGNFYGEQEWGEREWGYWFSSRIAHAKWMRDNKKSEYYYPFIEPGFGVGIEQTKLFSRMTAEVDGMWLVSTHGEYAGQCFLVLGWSLAGPEQFVKMLQPHCPVKHKSCVHVLHDHNGKGAKWYES